MSRVAGVILAAGTSSRLGSPKQLLDLGGTPVLAHTVAGVRNTTLDPIIVVLGHASEQIAATVDLSAEQTIVNADYRTGQSSSVRAALSAIADDVDGVLFILGDQPLVEPAVIEQLIDAFQQGHNPIVQPRYREGRGNPVLIGRSLFAELAEVGGDTGARPLIERHREQVRLVDVSEHSRPDDIDTLEDYLRIQRAFDARRDETE
ncbi:MAG TPA: nucleotidyltransferase family protein [Nitrolancea sp.]|jgi:molybdenum cofactor cytidylyltransferase|nr:nucleotidyltransferase family protein [Nitrolancea sp.]